MKVNKVLHIFDLDDTLVWTPKAVDVLRVTDGKIHCGDYVINKQAEEINSILFSWDKDIFFEQNEEIILRNKNNDLRIEDIERFFLTLEESKKKKVIDTFKVKDGKIVLRRFKAFFKTEATVGTIFNEVSLGEYNKASNKMILTGRSKSLLKGISYVLFNYLNLEFPNFGLYLFDGRKTIREFKLNTLVDSVKKNNWTEVHLWEDNEDWLNFIANEMKILYPNINFFKHLVK